MTPERIVVKCYRTRGEPNDKRAVPTKLRRRFSAEFVGGRHHGQLVDDCLSPEDAIGSLICQVSRSLESADEILTFLAGLFGDLSVRSVNVTLARAVWIAAQHPRRRNPGVRVDTSAVSRPAARGPIAPRR
jgi:hypothetical protein